ncbi:hypothetical protein MA9V1_171 [Chryseobacterium phage MA9V-1]|nr:hypothetical protein MA9V1_171 [Chryseobacterium phage MA9V-1]
MAETKLTTINYCIDDVTVKLASTAEDIIIPSKNYFVIFSTYADGEIRINSAYYNGQQIMKCTIPAKYIREKLFENK